MIRRETNHNPVQNMKTKEKKTWSTKSRMLHNQQERLLCKWLHLNLSKIKITSFFSRGGHLTDNTTQSTPHYRYSPAVRVLCLVRGASGGAVVDSVDGPAD